MGKKKNIKGKPSAISGQQPGRSNQGSTNIKKAVETKIQKAKNRKRILFYLLFILILTSLVFSNSLKNNFANWDDDDYIIKNTVIRDFSAEGIKKIFSEPYFSNYHPVTTITYALEYKYFKLDPYYYHLDNLLLHLFNVILVFFFIYSLTRKINLSWIVALFFAIHPMHVESVAWVSERKDLMYTLFFFAGLTTYVYYISKNKAKYLILTYIFCILSLLSKSAAVCFPLIILLIDYYMKSIKNQILSVRYWLVRIPFFLFALAMGIITVIAQKSSGAIADLTTGFTIIDRVFLVSYATLFYIVKMFVPIGLSAMHYYPVTHGGIMPIEYYLSLLIVIGIVILIIKSGKFRKAMIFGSLFYLASIIVVLQILPVGFAIASERYSYVPYIGLLFILGFLFENLYEGRKENLKKLQPLFIGVIVIYAIICSYITYNRNTVWENGISLFTDVIKKNPESFHGYWIRGSAYANKKSYKEAIADFDQALRLKAPNPAEILNNRGDAKNNTDDYKGALDDLNKAIQIKPDLKEAYCNRGNARDNLGDYKGALDDFDKAISLKPDMITAYVNKGVSLGKMNRLDEALKYFNKAISINPYDASAYLNRGNAKGIIKDFKGSIEDYNMSIKLLPDESGAYFNRAISKISIKDSAGACQDWQKALTLGNKAAGPLIDKICNKY